MSNQPGISVVNSNPSIAEPQFLCGSCRTALTPPPDASQVVCPKCGLTNRLTLDPKPSSAGGATIAGQVAPRPALGFGGVSLALSLISLVALVVSRAIDAHLGYVCADNGDGSMTCTSTGVVSTAELVAFTWIALASSTGGVIAGAGGLNRCRFRQGDYLEASLAGLVVGLVVLGIGLVGVAALGWLTATA